ncbi:unnamed protein product, partial [Pocillopora meandrina]
YSDCTQVDWNITLGIAGWVSCPLGKYLKGVLRAHISNSDGIDNIKAGQCCIPPHEFLDEDTECKTENWKKLLSRNHKWASCPEDYDFLRGFYHSNETFSDNIEQALCCRPKTYISRTTDCYLEDVGQKLDTEGWNTCRDWYYMAGVYRGGCNALSCIETFKCCKITAQDGVVLDHWLLNGQDGNVSLSGSPSFTKGRCASSNTITFNQSSSYASVPLINLGGRSFTIACWIKQTKSVKDETAAIYGDWRGPWNFLLSLKNREIIFHRHREGYGESQWWSAGSADVSFDAWTHVVVIWDHKKTAVSILANGLKVGENSFSSEDAFYGPTGNRYQIGDDGHWDDHQFYGSVMDLYVFGSALSLEQVNKLRGVPLIVNTTKSVSGGDVLVVWEPPLVGACPVVKYNVYYREVMSSARQQGNWYSVELDGSRTSCTLHLSCRKEYNVSVTSISESGESPFNDSKIWNFQTTGGIPSPPIITPMKQEISSNNITLSWSPQTANGCPLTMYSIHYRLIYPGGAGESWNQVNVTNVTKTSHTVSLEYERQYTIEMSAWNELGQSARSRPWIITTASSGSVDRTTENDTVKSSGSGSGKILSTPQLAGLLAGVCILLFVVFIAVIYLRRAARKSRKHASALRLRRSKSTIFTLHNWEVLPEQVVFGEEIGRGAFGKVLKGTFRESPGTEVFIEPRNKTVDFKPGETVAIKLLGGKLFGL